MACYDMLGFSESDALRLGNARSAVSKIAKGCLHVCWGIRVMACDLSVFIALRLRRRCAPRSKPILPINNDTGSQQEREEDRDLDICVECDEPTSYCGYRCSLWDFLLGYCGSGKWCCRCRPLFCIPPKKCITDATKCVPGTIRIWGCFNRNKCTCCEIETPSSTSTTSTSTTSTSTTSTSTTSTSTTSTSTTSTSTTSTSTTSTSTTSTSTTSTSTISTSTTSTSTTSTSTTSTSTTSTSTTSTSTTSTSTGVTCHQTLLCIPPKQCITDATKCVSGTITLFGCLNNECTCCQIE
ncbi:uncharacterized protein LOC143022289 [Oratosquilla oratoria]|uniref:uncharacterized protein LOC143022289 n=1 Tax=Oratosquilla oratoria TaxID=337810 RepID=UPI003F75FAA3